MTRVDFGSLTARDAADIALQRTAHLITLPRIGSPSYRAWVRGIEFLLHTESRFRKTAIFTGAMRDARREFVEIQRFLGDRTIDRMADIGCGHAFMDLMFYRQFSCDLTLIDIETSATHHHEFNSTGSGYASLAQAKAFLTTNGVPARAVETFNPQKTVLPAGPFDLMVSLLSAGFHYPIDDYAAYARSELRRGGVLIFDQRENTSQNPPGFSKIEVIIQGLKHQRLALTL